MKLLDSLRFRIATLLHRSKMNAEVEEELRSHIQHRADDLERSGLARQEAERRVERSSNRSSRIYASAFACCENLADSQSSLSQRWQWPSAQTLWFSVSWMR
jgi:hypothetical protein